MTRYKCHRCGKSSDRSGLCCTVAMEKTCGVCGYEIDQCLCTGGSTKEPRAKH